MQGTTRKYRGSQEERQQKCSESQELQENAGPGTTRETQGIIKKILYMRSHDYTTDYNPQQNHYT